ncbi:hypothetical protein ACUXAV_000800 [Cupriavidus metallidurans]|jgi:hypothetical protein|uniref:hypothetical protein n=1 Tax=Cupriavidus TaxID=106589 RepID=UPI0004932582|nr:hypothetical protein [Cupriavidus metallidurans]KWW37559.1 hypothetical protein AU374_01324 [Cupriavidus metallidurans]MDE4918701.1 hypothetical protein [Cupriavidus metallidurans]
MRDFRDIYEDGTFAMGGACPARQPHELRGLADELRRNDFRRAWRDFEYLEDQFARTLEKYGRWTMARFPGLRHSAIERMRREYARDLIKIAIVIYPDELRRIEQHIVNAAAHASDDCTTPITLQEVKRMTLAEQLHANERRWQR